MNGHEESAARISDVVQFGDTEEIQKALMTIRSAFLGTAEWIRKNKERNQTNLVLHNFLTASVPYLDLAISHLKGPVQILAFCARNLYEVHLQSRYAQKDDIYLKQWVAEAATDGIEILEGLLGLDVDNSAGQHDILKKEISRKELLLKKHGLERKKPYPIHKIATELGKDAEHRSLFKIFSKLLHPTSYLVNSGPAEIQNQETFNVLIIHIQLYAWDIVGNIRITTGYRSLD
jgi:hypothetical protein